MMDFTSALARFKAMLLAVIWLISLSSFPAFAQTTPNPPLISHTSRFYDTSITVTLQATGPGQTILYTLDGSEPHPNNLNAATYRIKTGYKRFSFSPEGNFTTDSLKTWIYSEPLVFEDATPQPNRYSRVNTTWNEANINAPFLSNPKAVVLRTRSVTANGDLSRISTRTYFIRARQDRLNHSLPVVAVTLSPDHLFSYDTGIYVAGAEFDRWRAENPTEPAEAFTPANYTLRGDEYEFPGSFEYFENEINVFSQQIGFRIHGGATRSFPLKSLRLYARNSYSTNTKGYPFFGSEHDSSFRRLILRNNGDDFLRGLMRDRYHHRMTHHLGLENQLDQPVVAYINGEYWGLMTIRERIDRHYINRRHNLNGAPIDLLEEDMVVDEGSADHYRQMMQIVEHSDITDPDIYATLNNMMDMDNYVRYLAAQLYVVNTDWPHNNIRFWRTTRAINNSPGKDGRWRWIFFDTDIGSLGTRYEINMFEHLATVDESLAWSRVLPLRLMQNGTFRNELLNRLAEEMNTHFAPEVLEELANEIKNEIAGEVQAHIQRWRRPLTYADWETSVQEIITFARLRPALKREHAITYFNLEGSTEVNLNQSAAGAGSIQIHTAIIDAAEHPVWSGHYFQQIPLQVQAIPAEGYKFTGWNPPFEHEQATFTLIPGPETLTLRPEFELVDVSTPEIASGYAIPAAYLLPNNPNPFNPVTNIVFKVEGEPTFVTLSIYDTMGRLVTQLAADRYPTGTHTLRFDATNLSSGVYVTVLKSQGHRQSRIITLLR